MELVPVRSSRIQTALVGIKTTMQQCEEDLKKSESSRLTPVFEQVQEMIGAQIMAAVQAVPPEEYKKQHVPFPTPVRQRFMNHEQEDDDDEMLIENSAPTQQDYEIMDSWEDADEELEEEELVDQEALAQAKMIRAKARQVALRNQQVAQVYLQRLTQMIDAEDAEYSRQQRMLPPAPSSSSTTTTTTTTTNSSPLDGKQEKMNSLRTHLTQLQQQLNELQVHLPTQREELQSTVDTINVYLEKQREEKEGGDSTKGSRDIENTITSRDNEGQPRWKSAATTTVMGNNTLVSNAKPLWKEKSAEMRLAHFLTNYP